MSYLIVDRARLVRRSRVRIDERTAEPPGFDGDAYVRVFVEDTSAAMRGAEPATALSCGSPTARTRSRSSSRSTRRARGNSLHKIDTLIALTLPDGSQPRRALRGVASCCAPQPERRSMSYLKRHRTRRVPQSAPLGRARCRTPPAATPGRSTTGRGCAAS